MMGSPSMNDAKTELWLVRHGQTEWSRTGRHTGRTDIPLTGQGRIDAAALTARLAPIEFDRVLTSPMSRARETCALAGFGERAEVIDDLTEWDYGSDEGLTTAEIRKDRPGWTIWTQEPRGGETADQIGARADRFLSSIGGSGRRVLAFSHGHMSRVLGARWIGRPATGGAVLGLDTSAICVLGWERETPILKLWNDTGRLPS